jgi:hypothetical protein
MTPASFQQIDIAKTVSPCPLIQTLAPLQIVTENAPPLECHSGQPPNAHSDYVL